MSLPLIVLHPHCMNHFTGSHHPERPERFLAIYKELLAQKLLTPQNSHQARQATMEEITLVHTPAYFELVHKEIEAGGTPLSTGDVEISKTSWEPGLLAAGAVHDAVDHTMAHKHPSFSLMRPPGHHAGPDYGMGFCLFNNIAIGARYAQKKYGIQRVLIADWDLHHGNGTQHIFWEDPSVFYFSTHEYPFYPGTGGPDERGKNAGLGFNLNVPIYPGPRAREEVIEAFSETLVEEMKAFKPELVMISAGFDAHHLDPLGHLNLTEEDFGTLTHIMKKIAHEHAQGRIVSVLEGGYHLPALAKSAAVHIKSLAN